MKAMILAAGLGTRLRPLTDTLPKALVEVGGRTLLDLVLERLRQSGVSEVIINVHHLADLILEHLEANKNYGMRIEISREDTLLDTGGGLKKASWFFLEDPDRLDEPFIVHNVDVLSTIDLERMTRFHRDRRPLATLAVQNRSTSRYLLFDAEDQLCGWQSETGRKLVRPSAHPRSLAFTGIHVISPHLLAMMQNEDKFSIIDTYLRLAAGADPILAFCADEYSWQDVGRPDRLKRAHEEPDRFGS